MATFLAPLIHLSRTASLHQDRNRTPEFTKLSTIYHVSRNGCSLDAHQVWRFLSFKIETSLGIYDVILISESFSIQIDHTSKIAPIPGVCADGLPTLNQAIITRLLLAYSGFSQAITLIIISLSAQMLFTGVGQVASFISLRRFSTHFFIVEWDL